MIDLLDTDLSDQKLAEVLQAIASIHQKLPYLVLFSPGDKKATSMLDEGRVPFALKAVEYASRETAISLNPPLLEAAKKDLKIYTGLQTVDRELSRLSEMVSDTRMLAGAEFYQLPTKCRKSPLHSLYQVQRASSTTWAFCMLRREDPINRMCL